MNDSTVPTSTSSVGSPTVPSSTSPTTMIPSENEKQALSCEGFEPLRTPSSSLLLHYITMFQSQNRTLHPKHLPNLLSLHLYYRNLDTEPKQNKKSGKVLPPTHSTHSRVRMSPTSPDIQKILKIIECMISKTIQRDTQASALDQLVHRIKVENRNVLERNDKDANANVSYFSQYGAYGHYNVNGILPSSHSPEVNPFIGSGPFQGMRGMKVYRPENVKDKNVFEQPMTNMGYPSPSVYYSDVAPLFWKELATILKLYFKDQEKSSFLTKFPLLSLIEKYFVGRDRFVIPRHYGELIRLRMYIESLFWKSNCRPEFLEMYCTLLDFAQSHTLLSFILPGVCRQLELITRQLFQCDASFFTNTLSAEKSKIAQDSIFRLAETVTREYKNWSCNDRRSVWIYLRHFTRLLPCLWMTAYRGTITPELVSLLCFHLQQSPEQHQTGEIAPESLRKSMEDLLKLIQNRQLSPSSFVNNGVSMYIRAQVSLFYALFIRCNSSELQFFIDALIDNQPIGLQLQIARTICQFFSTFNAWNSHSRIRQAIKESSKHLIQQLKVLWSQDSRKSILCDRLHLLCQGEIIVYSPEIHHYEDDE